MRARPATPPRFGRPWVVAALIVAVAAAVQTAAWSPWARAGGIGVITGTAFEDLNANGTQDAGEPPLANEQLYLYGAAGYVAATGTDAGGGFEFSGLSAGQYSVRFSQTSWWSLDNAWVLTGWTPTPAGLAPSVAAFLGSDAATAVATLPMRPIVRSTNIAAPLSTYTAPDGTVINSYDDVVNAAAIGTALSAGRLFGPEAPVTTVYFDINTATDATTGESGNTPGSYANYSASLWISYASWLTNYDEVLFHEYGHAWGNYNAYIVQQDPTYTAYLQARGLAGNPSLGSNKYWDPNEMLAEDYRQLFGSPGAAAYPQANTQIPPAAQVPGLAAFLAGTYAAPPAQPLSPVTPPPPPPTQAPPPTVSGVTPATGPLHGGTVVTVWGSGFSGIGYAATAVYVGTARASAFSVVSPSELLVTVPPVTKPASVDLTVTTVGGTSATSTADRFSYTRH